MINFSFLLFFLKSKLEWCNDIKIFPHIFLSVTDEFEKRGKLWTEITGQTMNKFKNNLPSKNRKCKMHGETEHRC